VPRVLNAALALFLLAFLAPALTNWGDLRVWVRVVVVLVSLPVLLVAGLCVASAARPGSLGRAARKARARRQAKG
jgi:hypothetical protein